MPQVFRPTYKDKRTGKTRQSQYWFARIGGRRIPLRVTDKRVAERKAAELERQAELGHDPNQVEKARRRSLPEHLQDFEESVKAQGCGHGHLKNLLPRLRKVIQECGFRTLAEVSVGKIESLLARWQREQGMSTQTRKHHVTHLRQFGQWLVTSGRAVRNPFEELKRSLNVEADRRHIRRALTPAECQKLLATVRASKATRGLMCGRDRYFLYRLATETGLRRNELGATIPESFDLDAATPTIAVAGAFTKNRKQALLPLRRDLAQELRPWLANKPAGKVLFPVKDKQVHLMIRADLAEAGISGHPV